MRSFIWKRDPFPHLDVLKTNNRNCNNLGSSFWGVFSWANIDCMPPLQEEQHAHGQSSDLTICVLASIGTWQCPYLFCLLWFSSCCISCSQACLLQQAWGRLCCHSWMAQQSQSWAPCSSQPVHKATKTWCCNRIWWRNNAHEERLVGYVGYSLDSKLNKVSWESKIFLLFGWFSTFIENGLPLWVGPASLGCVENVVHQTLSVPNPGSSGRWDKVEHFKILENNRKITELVTKPCRLSH